MEFLKYVEDGQEHLASVIERKNSNCSRRVNWVSKTTPRHSKFYPNNDSRNANFAIGNTATDRLFETDFAQNIHKEEHAINESDILTRKRQAEDKEIAVGDRGACINLTERKINT